MRKLFVLDPPKIVVHIADNGNGIEEAILDQIFVPFFTIKKEGSGNGLSLGRQIILLQHGSINVSSQLGKGTVFTIKLNVQAYAELRRRSGSVIMQCCKEFFYFTYFSLSN